MGGSRHSSQLRIIEIQATSRPGIPEGEKMGYSEASESITWIVSLTDSRVFRVHHHRRPPSPAA